MLIRFTKAIGGHTVGEIASMPEGQAAFILKAGNAIPVEQGKDGRVTIVRSARKVPRRDRSENNEDSTATVD